MGQSISKLIKAGNDFRVIADDEFSSAETVIDFSHPLSTSKIIKKCVENRIPLIIGTTGLKEEQIKQINDAKNTIPVLLAANMSIGIHNLKKAIKFYIDNELDDLNCLIEEKFSLERTL